jgi:hypothetical protein
MHNFLNRDNSRGIKVTIIYKLIVNRQFCGESSSQRGLNLTKTASILEVICRRVQKWYC